MSVSLIEACTKKVASPIGVLAVIVTLGLGTAVPSDATPLAPERPEVASDIELVASHEHHSGSHHGGPHHGGHHHIRPHHFHHQHFGHHIHREGFWNGYHGYRYPRPGYRRYRDGYWYPAAAFNIIIR